MSPDESAKSFASKGGKARAEKLTQEERSEIARNAVRARWEKEGKLKQPPIISATHIGELNIGTMQIPCAVLEDGRRVISDRGISKALGVSRTGSHWAKKRVNPSGAVLPVYLDKNVLKPYINSELSMALKEPVMYATTGNLKNTAHGIDANVMPKICEVWIDARKAGKLSHPAHIATAEQADLLLRGFATVGINALVDEATGYQSQRTRDALEKILNAFISKELRKWTKTFPDEYYEQIFRLNKWKYPLVQKHKRPSVIGKYTKDIVYDRLAPGIVKELEKRNPLNEKGNRKHTHHQHLSEDIGHPKLREHISNVIVLMKASETWNGFKRILDKAIGSKNKNLELFEEDEF